MQDCKIYNSGEEMDRTARYTHAHTYNKKTGFYKTHSVQTFSHHGGYQTAGS